MGLVLLRDKPHGMHPPSALGRGVKDFGEVFAGGRVRNLFWCVCGGGGGGGGGEQKF